MSKVVQKCEFSIGNTRIEVVLQGGFSEQGVHRTVDMHCHPNFEVHYIEEGEFRFAYGDTEIPVGKDTLVIIPPKLYHAFHSESENLKRISFEFRMIKLRSGADLFTEYDLLLSSVSAPLISHGFITEFVSIGESMGIIQGEEEICKLNAHFTLVFLKVCDILRNKTSKRSTTKLARTAQIPPSDDDMTVIRILNYIHSNCRRALSLSEVARAVSISERQIQRILNARMGEGFHSILTQDRIAVAKELILETSTNHSLEEIAYECGFSNYVSFWMQFKKHTGQTPEEFRKRI